MVSISEAINEMNIRVDNHYPTGSIVENLTLELLFDWSRGIRLWTLQCYAVSLGFGGILVKPSENIGIFGAVASWVLFSEGTVELSTLLDSCERFFLHCTRKATYGAVHVLVGEPDPRPVRCNEYQDNLRT